MSDPVTGVIIRVGVAYRLDIELLHKTLAEMDLMPVKHELPIRIERELRENGIEIPFPQRDLWIHSEAGPASSENLRPEDYVARHCALRVRTK